MRLLILVSALIFQIKVLAQTTQLQISICALDEITFSNFLIADPIVGANQYCFKIVNETYDEVDSIVKLVNWFNLNEFNVPSSESPVCRYNSNLLVSVAVDLGQGFGSFGSSCNLRTIFPVFGPETLGRSVFSTLGGTLVGEAGTNEFILTNALGETKTNTVMQNVPPSNTFTLNEGFQQSEQWFIDPLENEILVPELKIGVYPNPFSRNIELHSESFSTEGIIADIYSYDGRLIYSCHVDGGNNELLLNHLSPGQYIFEFTGQKSNSKSIKYLIKSY
tara:strand:- start:679 stop:1512 length:834 start_codon:yes stop_codon:yes gene_type:complete